MALRRSPKPWRLHGTAGEGPAQLVDHERGQGLALHLLGHDEERLACVGHCSSNGSISFMLPSFFS